MNYEIETISEKDWEELIQLFPNLSGQKSRPRKRAIEQSTNSFILNVSTADDARDACARCKFFYKGRWLNVSIRGRKSDGLITRIPEWWAWHGIQEAEIGAINESLISATRALFDLHESDPIVPKVNNNPFYEITKEELINVINAAVTIWYDSKRIKDMRKRTNDLIQAKKTFFKWRFYLLRMMPMPSYNMVEESLIEYLKPYFINPKHKVILLQHLDEGGACFSEDTKRFLHFARKNNLYIT